MRRTWIFGGLVAAVLIVLAYAWVNGGREPVHAIASPIPLPEGVQ